MSGCIPYRRRPPPVRNMRAVLKKASWCTRRIFRCPPCSKQASGAQKGYSVPEIPFYGTGRGFMCAGKGLLVYRMKRRKAASALRSVILRKTDICILLLLPLNSRSQLWTTSNCRQTAADSCGLPPNHCKPLQIATKPLQIAAGCRGLPQTTANSAKLSQAAASYSQTTAEPPGPLSGSLKLRRGVSVNRRSISMIIFARTEP